MFEGNGIVASSLQVFLVDSCRSNNVTIQDCCVIGNSDAEINCARQFTVDAVISIYASKYAVLSVGTLQDGVDTIFNRL